MMATQGRKKTDACVPATLLQRNGSSVHLETFLSTHRLARYETNLAHQVRQLKQTSDDGLNPRILGECKIPWMYHEITQPSILSCSRASLTINPYKSLKEKGSSSLTECALPNLPDVCFAIACDGSDSCFHRTRDHNVLVSRTLGMPVDLPSRSETGTSHSWTKCQSQLISRHVWNPTCPTVATPHLVHCVKDCQAARLAADMGKSHWLLYAENFLELWMDLPGSCDFYVPWETWRPSVAKGTLCPLKFSIGSMVLCIAGSLDKKQDMQLSSETNALCIDLLLPLHQCAGKSCSTKFGVETIRASIQNDRKHCRPRESTAMLAVGMIDMIFEL